MLAEKYIYFCGALNLEQLYFVHVLHDFVAMRPYLVLFLTMWSDIVVLMNCMSVCAFITDGSDWL